MCKISIIIPTFNAEATISNALKSILSQHFQDFEVLVMDGGSTDGTSRILEAYNDSRIRVFSEGDKGVYDAMNKGIAFAKGDWLYFLGSDDVLRDDQVFSAIAPFLEYDQHDLVYGNAYLLKQQRVYDGPFDRWKLMWVGNICHQAIFYHKSLFERLGKYNLKFKIWADWDFNIRCFSYPAIRHLHVNLVVADYNDIDGLSNQMPYDPDFYQLLPVSGEGSVIERFKQTSKAYKLGRRMLKPERFIKKMFGRSRT